MGEIKVGDLMIGNYYCYQFNEKIVKVESIVKDDEWHGGYMIISECGQKTGIAACSPIPITEDILLKAGFGKKDDQYYLIIQTGVSSNAVYFEFEIVNGDVFGSMWIDKEIENTRKIFLEVKYVHQLQNLFKSLTGNDLKIEV